MAAIKSLGATSKKWAEVTPQRAGQYAEGVQAPKSDWAKNAEGANAAWKEGVSKASQADRFAKGVRAAGTGRWQEGAIGKGVQRFGPGVALAAPRYESGFAPYHRAIEALTLPPRFARRDPRNLERVKAVVAAMVATKERGG